MESSQSNVGKAGRAMVPLWIVLAGGALMLIVPVLVIPPAQFGEICAIQNGLCPIVLPSALEIPYFLMKAFWLVSSRGIIAASRFQLLKVRGASVRFRIILVSFVAMYWLGLAVMVVSGIFGLELSQYAYHGNPASLFIGPVLALIGSFLIIVNKKGP